MSFFKKIGKGISSVAKKAPSVVSSIFKKGGSIATGISSGLDKVGDVLGKVGSVVNNPLVQAGASSVFGPEAGQALGSLGKGISRAKDISRMGSGLAGKAGALSTEASGYKSVADIKGGIQKAKDLYAEGRGVAGPTFV
jgi:hypothetical protein